MQVLPPKKDIAPTLDQILAEAAIADGKKHFSIDEGPVSHVTSGARVVLDWAMPWEITSQFEAHARS